jgi:hypothetical protein
MKKLFLIASIFACSVAVVNGQTTKKEVSSGKKVNAPAVQADPSKQAVKPVKPTSQQVATPPANAQKQERPTPKPAAPSTIKEDKKAETAPSKAPLKKDGTPDKRYKANQQKLKKDGTPDMRYKENKPVEKKKN